MTKIKLDESFMKSVRLLIEGEVEEAEVIMAARGFSKEFQDMIQKVGRLANEQVGPVVDQIRLTYGPDMANSFNEIVQGRMNEVLETISNAKEALDDVVLKISSGQMPNGQNDMDTDDFGGESELGGDEGISSDEGEADIGAEEPEFEDEFGGEEPLGRSALESKEYALKQKIVEMKKMLAKAKKLKEKK